MDQCALSVVRYISHSRTPGSVTFTIAMTETVKEAAAALYPLVTQELSDQSPKTFGLDSWTLARLDVWRRTELPATLKSRFDEHKIHLAKDELALLMDWKLAKGKFRPTLPKLIQSNDADTVVQVTQAGLGMFMDYAQEWKSWGLIPELEYQQAVKSSLKKICELRGVGPATASLILSLLTECTPFAAPFFSDEAFMYFVQEPLKPEVPIKYNVKEYVDEYVGVLFNIVVENKTSMAELENGGWALKIYYENRITKLSPIKLPFEVDDGALKQFSAASKYMPVVEKKRKALTTKGTGKRSKKN